MHINKKSILIGSAVLILVPLGIYTLSLSLQKRLQQSNTSTSENTGSMSNTYPTGNSFSTITPKQPLLTPQGAIPPVWIREEDPEYAVAYPPDWHSESFPSIPQEPTQLYIALVPKTATVNDIFPRLDILFYSATQTSVQEQIQKVTSLYNKYTKNGSMQQTVILFQGLNATQASGIIDGAAYTQGNPMHKDVVKTFIIFQKGQNVYVVDDAYYNDETAGVNHQLLLQILATMNFPH